MKLSDDCFDCIEARWFSGEKPEQIDIRPKYTRQVIQKQEPITQWIVNDERK